MSTSIFHTNYQLPLTSYTNCFIMRRQHVDYNHTGHNYTETDSETIQTGSTILLQFEPCLICQSHMQTNATWSRNIWQFAHTWSPKNPPEAHCIDLQVLSQCERNVCTCLYAAYCANATNLLAAYRQTGRIGTVCTAITPCYVDPSTAIITRSDKHVHLVTPSNTS